MTFRDPITDEDIEDYLADRLPRTRRAQVEAWLRDHPDVDAEVRAMSEHQEALRSIGADILNEPIPSHLLALIEDESDSPQDCAEQSGSDGIAECGAGR